MALFYLIIKIKQMKEGQSYLLVSVALAIVTTFIILLLFATLEVGAVSFGVITMASILGYMSSALYYYSYKDVRKNKLKRF
jgi:hypothetical protein